MRDVRNSAKTLTKCSLQSVGQNVRTVAVVFIKSYWNELLQGLSSVVCLVSGNTPFLGAPSQDKPLLQFQVGQESYTLGRENLE